MMMMMMMMVRIVISLLLVVVLVWDHHRGVEAFVATTVTQPSFLEKSMLPSAHTATTPRPSVSRLDRGASFSSSSLSSFSSLPSPFSSTSSSNSNTDADNMDWIIPQAQRVVREDFGVYDASLLDDDHFSWIEGPFASRALDKIEYLAAMRFFDVRAAFPDLDYRSYDYRIIPNNNDVVDDLATTNNDELTVRLTCRVTGTMRGILRLRTETLPPTGQRMICPPEAVTMTFSTRTRKVMQLCTGFPLDRQVGNTDGYTGIQAAALMAGQELSEWDRYPPAIVLSRFFGRPISSLPESKLFLAPFPETVMIQLAKGIIATQMGLEDPTLLSQNEFAFLTPLVGPVSKKEYLQKYVAEEFRGLCLDNYNNANANAMMNPTMANNPISPIAKMTTRSIATPTVAYTQLEFFRVDPYDPLRIWVDVTPRMSNGYIGSPQALSFVFDEEGFCTRITSSAVMDVTVGNGGGLSGMNGVRYYSSSTLSSSSNHWDDFGTAVSLFFTARPLPNSLGRWRQRLLQPFTRMAPDDYLIRTTRTTSRRRTTENPTAATATTLPFPASSPSRGDDMNKNSRSANTESVTAPLQAALQQAADVLTAARQPTAAISGQVQNDKKKQQQQLIQVQQQRKQQKQAEQQKLAEKQKRAAQQQQQRVQQLANAEAQKRDAERKQSEALRERERERQAAAQREETEKKKLQVNAKAEAERNTAMAKAEAERKAAQVKAEAERKAAQAKAEAERKAAQAKAKELRAANERRNREKEQARRLAEQAAIQEEQRRLAEAEQQAYRQRQIAAAEASAAAAESARQRQELERERAIERQRSQEEAKRRTEEMRKADDMARRATLEAAAIAKDVERERQKRLKASQKELRKAKSSATLRLFNLGMPAPKPSKLSRQTIARDSVSNARLGASISLFGMNSSTQSGSSSDSSAAKQRKKASETASKAAPGATISLFGIGSSGIASGVKQQQQSSSQAKPRPSISLFPIGSENTRESKPNSQIVLPRPTFSLFGGTSTGSNPVTTSQPRPTLSIFGGSETKLQQSKSLPVAKQSSSSSLKTKSSVIAPSGVPTLKNWRKSPGNTVTGNISGSRLFISGEKVTTSRIASGTISSGEVVRTESGSRYFLQ